MGKVCIACGAVPLPQTPEEQPADCPECGGKGTVQEEETAEDEEESK